jgi:hypothetical protein
MATGQGKHNTKNQLDEGNDEAGREVDRYVPARVSVSEIELIDSGKRSFASNVKVSGILASKNRGIQYVMAASHRKRVYHRRWNYICPEGLINIRCA